MASVGTAVQKVLIVEDDEDIRSLLLHTLEENDIPAIAAENGTRAIEIALHEGISLMTIDYSLPDMTGDEIVLSLRRSDIDIPFIMITGVGDEEVAVRSMKLGARDYLGKDDKLFDNVARVVPDILDKLQSEEQLRVFRSALQESEERFSKVFHNSNDGIILLDEEITIIDINKKALLYLDFEPSIDTSDADLALIISSDIKSILLSFLHNRDEAPVYRFEAIFRQKDGKSFLADVVLSTFIVHGQINILLNFRDLSDRLKHLETIKKAADEWKVTFDSINDMVSVHDLNMRIIKVNKAFADFVGKPYTEIVGQKCYEILHPTSGIIDNCPHKRTVDEGVTVTEEIFHQDFSIPLLVTTSPILNDQGEVSGSVHIAKNISELKKVHADLNEREQFLVDILDSIQDGITILDTEFRIVRVNRYLEKKYAEKAPLVGKYCFNVFQSREEPCEVCPSKRTIETKEPASEILSHTIPNDKKRCWMEVFTYPLFEPDSGDVSGVIEYMRDITQRFEIEQMLLESEEKYRCLFEDADDAILVTEVDTGIISDCNKAAEILTGWNKEELIGMHQEELHPREERLAGKFSETLEEHRRLPDGEILQAKVLRKDSTIRDVSIKTTGISFHGKKYLQGVFQDISESQRKKKRIKQSQKLESIGTLASGIAHDFNNILTAVVGFSEIIKVDLLEGKQPDVDDVKGILEAADRASDLVKQILMFSRESEMEPRSVDITPIIKETVRFLKASLPSTIRIKEQYNSIKKRIFADPVQIHQVLMNLCTNAHHAMRQKGGILSIILDEVILTCENIDMDKDSTPGEYICITISDTGHGMDKLILERIFDPFFSTKSRDEGTGLGLSVVHGIVKDHGGFINVYSDIGLGTTFKVYLPIIHKTDEQRKKLRKRFKYPKAVKIFYWLTMKQELPKFCKEF